MCSQCNGYRHIKYTWRPESKFRRRLFAFGKVLILLGKV